MRKLSDIIFDYIDDNSIEVSNEFARLDKGLRVDEYSINNTSESKKYGKPMGKYALLSIPEVLLMYGEDIEYTIDILYKLLKNIVGNIKQKDRVLIVGLGNRHISSDSLGAKIVGKVNVTIESEKLPKVMAIAPSVLGLTGIETYDIISGVVDKVKPTHIILIDSLCASSDERLGKSIQLTSTGICPGSGIGNRRKCIDKSLAPNVFSIGVPLLIYASTFVSSACEKNNIDLSSIDCVMQKLKKQLNVAKELDVLNSVKNILNDKFDNCIVSIKDIEECVEKLSNIISTAINRLLGVEDIYL